MHFKTQFDVIVIGGGHAGTEAALAAARMGAKTLLLSHNINTVGEMSCNPAIGGIGKGQLVKEIDALGGVMGIAAELGGIQCRVLNRSKGPAVRSTRMQADRALYRQAIRTRVEHQENLSVFQQAVDALIIEGEAVKGVITQGGICFFSKATILSSGTFLSGKIHIGQTQYAAGRAGDPPVITLAQQLRELPFKVGRLKTGTPPRIDGRTIDYSVMQPQPGDSPLPSFSFWSEHLLLKRPRQIPCFITHTNANTHAIIEKGLAHSPLFTGAIEGTGPRYCPSIEDKIVRFASRESHQIFIEPEGLETPEIYPNGISTSLPFEVQFDLVHSIRGLEQAHITRAGYAIEYDFFDPRDLKPTLETKVLKGLFFAGQINGTTGYEEAAAQGLVAGMNAAALALERDPWIPNRSQCYIGVLIDDLVTAGTKEPYRMFSSRAEYRLSLREDNADRRLCTVAKDFGLISDAQWHLFEQKEQAIAQEQQRLRTLWIRPQTPAALYLQEILGQSFKTEHRVDEILKRPEVDYKLLMCLEELGPAVIDHRVAEQVEISLKYAGYIDRQQKEIERSQRYDYWPIPDDFDYSRISGLSIELCEKLTQVKPKTLAQGMRIPGMTPAAISLLLVYLRKNHD